LNWISDLNYTDEGKKVFGEVFKYFPPLSWTKERFVDDLMNLRAWLQLTL